MLCEVREALLPTEDVQLYRLGVTSPGLIPGRDKEVAGPGWKEGGEILGVLGVIEDEQPPAGNVTAQLLQG